MRNYKTWIFDCDGVILDSNCIKSNAFYQVGAIYSTEIAIRLKRYHVENGGVSRYKKMEYLQSEILGNKVDKEETERLARIYHDICWTDLLSCNLADGAMQVIETLYSSCNIHLVSGSDEAELKELMRIKNIHHYFDTISGSPATKYEIYDCLFKNSMIENPVISIGDSKLDFEVANHFGAEFVFLSQLTEMQNWERFVNNNGCKTFNSLTDIFNLLV